MDTRDLNEWDSDNVDTKLGNMKGMRSWLVGNDQESLEVSIGNGKECMAHPYNMDHNNWDLDKPWKSDRWMDEKEMETQIKTIKFLLTRANLEYN